MAPVGGAEAGGDPQQRQRRAQEQRPAKDDLLPMPAAELPGAIQPCRRRGRDAQASVVACGVMALEAVVSVAAAAIADGVVAVLVLVGGDRDG